MGFLDIVRRALLGLAGYREPRGYATRMLSIGAPEVAARIDAMGGEPGPQAHSKSEWYLADLDAAEQAADRGELGPAARLMRSAQRDGRLRGVLSTRTDGLVRLPKKIVGAPHIVAELLSTAGSVRSTFDEMYPPSELALLGQDGILLGVGVAQMRQLPGRSHRVMVRLDPEYLRYSWVQGQWWYDSVTGPLPITPGDGNWILHTPGGRVAPWNNGSWKAVARAFIRKENASLSKDNYESTLANPALVAETPASASEAASTGFFRRLANAWGLNTLFGLRPGYKITVLESNGRGWECFNETITEQNDELTIIITGQTVTTDGGTGFSNQDIHKSIRADLIQATADGLAFTINSQGLPAWIVERWGLAALLNPACVAWDVTPPRDLAQRATSLQGASQALQILSTIYGNRLDLDRYAADFGIPLLPASPTLAAPQPQPPLPAEMN